MRIAIQDAFPNRPLVAEAEFIQRALDVCHRLGFDALKVVTSDDILRFRPDCVLVTHEMVPKLTPFPTLGPLWSPCVFYADDPVRRKSILSHDGWLCGSEKIAEWLGDFLYGQGKPAIIHEGLFLPSAPDCGPARALPAGLALMYVGSHWDGTRHGAIFRGLSERVPLRIYGPPEKWTHVVTNYQGPLPYDGRSVIEAIRASGIALCLHKAAHRKYNCPSMRLFEAAAAGALIISDDFAFTRQWFRDSVLYVDSDLPASHVIEQIVAHVEWARANPEAANRLARRSNELFRHALSLDCMLTPLPEFVDRVRKGRHMVVSSRVGCEQPTVEYIVRVGSRQVNTVARALDSLANQTYRAIAVTIVQFHPVDGLDDLINHHSANFEWVRKIIVPNNGRRSTAWWAGLRNISADFFGILDDDDIIHPNHVATVMHHFNTHPECGFVYSGVIRVEEELCNNVTSEDFEGIVEENRELYLLDPYDPIRMANFDNTIASQTWVCRSSVLDGNLLIDPLIEHGEDMYFSHLVASRAKIGFTCLPTACWTWRSTTRDNHTLSLSSQVAVHAVYRSRERLQNANLISRISVERHLSAESAQSAVNSDIS